MSLLKSVIIESVTLVKSWFELRRWTTISNVRSGRILKRFSLSKTNDIKKENFQSILLQVSLYYTIVNIFDEIL